MHAAFMRVITFKGNSAAILNGESDVGIGARVAGDSALRAGQERSVQLGNDHPRLEARLMRAAPSALRAGPAIDRRIL